MTDMPVQFRYEGEGQFSPLSSYWARKADDRYVVGEVYKMAEVADRSINSHNHYFATIADGWETMRDDLRELYPSPEHLRKKALIRCGYRNERDYVCASKAAAEELVRTIRPLDDYAIIEARENVVRIWTAKSQSRKAMPGKGEFQASKEKVLDFIDDLLGVERGATAKAAA